VSKKKNSKCEYESERPTKGSFRASDGARVEYFELGNKDKPTVLISPAFTGSAELYVEKFGSALSEYRVIGIELRGHGKGGGCKFKGHPYCSGEQAPDKGKYFGFRIERLAADVHEAITQLDLPKKVVLMGHSLGGNVLYSFVSQYGTKALSGLFIYDQSPKNLAVGTAENARFPLYASYPMADVLNLVSESALYTPRDGYYMLPSVLRTMLGGPDGNPVLDPKHPSPSFVLEQDTWDCWNEFAENMNGKVVSMLLWNTLVSSYTDVIHTIKKSKLPVLVYGGKMSIVPWQAMRWVHEQLPGSEFILFDEQVGVHGAFLNPDPSGCEFMDRVRDFLDRCVPHRDCNKTLIGQD
jgi:non-heme chloroperoxidase